MLEVEGFAEDEIENFSAADLDHILRRLIKKGRSFATFQGQGREGQMNAAKAWFHALELYERSNAKIGDRSIIFPIYSGLMIFLKGEMILQDEEGKFEQNLADTFCLEAKSVHDPIHYVRALAVKCEVLGRLGEYEKALETFEELSREYRIEEHSQPFTKAYGTDRAAQMHSQRAYWYYRLGNVDEAVKCCEGVIEQILPWMETKNVLNTFELLLPAIRLLKTTQGHTKYLSDVYEENLMRVFQAQAKSVTLCRPVLTPLSMLLKVAGNPKGVIDIKNIVQWLLVKENGEIDDFLDNLYSKLGWAPNSITAELCLLTAKQLQEASRNMPKVKTLVLKGAYLSRRVERMLKFKHGVQMAFEIHEPVMKELEEMAESLGILSEVEDPAPKEVTTGKLLKTSLGEVSLVDM
jgi:tetratricopeptide (TPR) repeat protein